MKTEMTKPCDQCPFRSDIRPFLRADRVEEICTAVLELDQSFSCHKTIDYSDADPDEESTNLNDAEEVQHCAGAMIFLEKQDRPNQWMRWMERLGVYNRQKLDMTIPVYESAEAMIDAQKVKEIK